MGTSKFEFDAKTTALIDQLKIDTESSSRSEVLRKALFLLDTAVKAKRDGSTVELVSSDGSSQQIRLY